MPSAAEDARRATIPLVRGPHPRADDEDMHPATLDEDERKLERALKELEKTKEKEKAKRISGP
jgi:hypothetical protein